MNELVRLQDIRAAYLKQTGETEGYRIGDWKDNQDTRLLIEYLEDESNEFYERQKALTMTEVEFMDPPVTPDMYESEVVAYPKGRRGGMYVCRELAHHYAMWLDVRYAAHVLRAFDRLASGNIVEAVEYSMKVCTIRAVEDWEGRRERMKGLGLDSNKLINMVVKGLTGLELADPDALPGMLVERGKLPTLSLLESILSFCESVILLGGDPMAKGPEIVKYFGSDPRMEDFIIEMVSLGEEQ